MKAIAVIEITCDPEDLDLRCLFEILWKDYEARVLRIYYESEGIDQANGFRELL